MIWRTSYPAPFKMNPATAPHGPGPKSTPTFADNRIFTLGMSGMVTAFDAQSGKQIWQKPSPPVEPLYHTAMSPLVDGNRVIVHVGGHDNGALTAFDVATGEVRWSWNGDGPAYGSPLLFNLSGTRQVVTFTQKNFVGVSAATGELLWRRPYTTPSNTTSQTPILHKNMVIEMGRANGVTAFVAASRGGQWATENIWHTDEVSMHMSDAVVVNNVLYGLSHLNSGEYFALDLDTRQGALEERAAAGRACRDRAGRQHDLLARRRQRAGRSSSQSARASSRSPVIRWPRRRHGRSR